MINKEIFYQEYRKYFGKRLSQSTVDTIEAILDEFNRNINNSGPRAAEKFAYMMATVRHEVGPKMIPIIENMNYTASRIRQVWPSRFKTVRDAEPYARNPEKLANNVYANRLGNGSPSSGDGYRYRGRGIGAQFTGKVNYEKFSKLFGIDFVNNPDLALDRKLGAKILYKGSMEGLFTGVSLNNYITSCCVDYVNARRVINADVKLNGNKIASDAKKFEMIFKKAGV